MRQYDRVGRPNSKHPCRVKIRWRISRVTGVQTCALPIFDNALRVVQLGRTAGVDDATIQAVTGIPLGAP